MKNRILIFLASLIVISCGNDEQREYSVTFVFDKPIAGSDNYKYPKYFNEILTPFSSDCKIDFFPKPINILRLDISNKSINTNALTAYENSGLDQGIESYTDYIGQYFNDSTNAYLYKPGKNIVNIENWIESNNKNLYILSEEITVDEYKGIPIYHATKDLIAKIQSSACKDSLSKLVILVNPTLGNNPPPSGDSIKPQILSFTSSPTSIQKGNTATLSWEVQNANTVSISGLGSFPIKGSTQVSPQTSNSYTLTASDVNGNSVNKTIVVNVQNIPGGGGGHVPPPPPIKCKDQVVPGANDDVEDYFALVGNRSIDNQCKVKLKSYLYNYFTNDAEIVKVTNNCSDINTLSPNELYESILGSGNKLYIQSQCENRKSGNKYSKLSIQIGR